MTARLSFRGALARRVVPLALVFVLLGCGEGVDMTPTITLVEAQRRVESIIRETSAQLAGGAEVVPAENRHREPLPCEGSGGLEFSGQVFVEYWYRIKYPDGWPIGQVVDDLGRYWESSGYGLVREDLSDPMLTVRYVRDPARNVSVGVKLYHRQNGDIDAFLIGLSECVWPNGTPSPSG